MKILILSIFLLVANTCVAQVVIDKTIATRYNKAVNKLPAKHQEIARSNVNFGDHKPGFAVFSSYHIDTLNKTDKLVYNSKMVVHDVDVSTGKIMAEINAKEEAIDLTYFDAKLRKDTLILSVGFMYPKAVIKIIKGKVYSHYEEYSKRDTIYRMNLMDSKTESLNIPATISPIKLSAPYFKPNQVIYGEMSLNTAPYYLDDHSFKTGYLKQRLRCKFYI
jgi:hypothetical protein